MTKSEKKERAKQERQERIEVLETAWRLQNLSLKEFPRDQEGLRNLVENTTWMAAAHPNGRGTVSRPEDLTEVVRAAAHVSELAIRHLLNVLNEGGKINSI
jgi:hypothetical protein